MDSLRFICLSSKRWVLNNGQLEFTVSFFFQVVSPKQWTAWVKWWVLNNGQLEFTFSSFFQVVSPKQWTAWVKRWVLNNGQFEVYFLSSKWSVLNNGRPEVILLSCLSNGQPQTTTTFVYPLISQESSPVCLVKCVSPLQTNTKIHHHFPSETTPSASGVRSLSQQIEVSRHGFSSQSKCLRRPAFIAS